MVMAGGMRMRLRRILGTVGLAVVVMLVCGVAVAEASTQPVLVGAVQDTNTATGFTSGTVSVATQNTAGGWFAYTPSYYSDELTSVSMANPFAPSIAGEGAPSGTQLDGADTVNIFGGIAYVVSKNENGPCTGPVGGGSCDVNDNGSGNALSLFDVSTDPTTPAYLGSIQDTSDGGGSNGVSDGGTSAFRRLWGDGHLDRRGSVRGGCGAGLSERPAVPEYRGGQRPRVDQCERSERPDADRVGRERDFGATWTTTLTASHRGGGLGQLRVCDLVLRGCPDRR